MLKGGSGIDYLYGHAILDGGSGNDYVEGGYVYDPRGETRTLRGGTGQDRITSASKVNDTIYAQDGEKDTISCGGGTDTVYFDEGIDSVNPINCENLNPRDTNEND